MRNLSRGIFFFLVLMIAIPAVASSDSFDINNEQPPTIAQEQSDSATVRVIPNEARVGSQHIILVTGLNASESISIRITQVTNDVVVYTTTGVADDRGILEVEIFTEVDDTAGTYLVEVFNASETVIGSAELEILEAEVYTPEIMVTPLQGEAGTIFTIEIVGAEPFLLLDIEIDNQAREEIFEQEARTNVDGDVTIEFVSDRETLGTLVLTIVADAEIIFTQEITVVAQALQGTVEATPDAILPAETVFITVSGASPETALRVDVVFDDTVIDSLDVTSNISGLAIFEYTFPDDGERGDYDIFVYEVDELIAETTVLVDILPVSTTVTPTVGTVGTVFFVSVADLRPDEAITVQLMRDGDIVQSRETTADADGIGRVPLGQRIDLEIGTYSIEVIRLGEVVSTTSVEIADERPATPQVINPDDISLTIDPLTGPVPTIYTITVEGLPAEQNITLFVLRDGESVFSTGATADENGVYTTELTSEPTDPPGTYTIEIRAEGNVVASSDFEIADETETSDSEDDDTSEQDEQTEDEVVPTVESDVTLDIQPSTLRQGERIEFILRDLEPDEVVLFELRFQDEIIYRAEPMADDNGVATVALIAREDEALGDYEVRILRQGEVIVVDGFTIVTQDAVIDNAQVVVEPTSGAQGTEYTITVTDLMPDEVVTITVNIDDAVVFEDERIANENGTVSVTLNSDVTDALGVYDVTITRADSDALTSTLEITDGEDVAVQPDDDGDGVTITIDPTSGEIGTEHIVTVTGLEPNETFTLTIEFDGEVVYTVERNADENGTFETVIAAAEGDEAGDYEVIIDRTDADDITGILTVLGDESVASSELSIEIDPSEVVDGEPFDVIVSGLEPDESVNIQIEYDGDVVFEVDREADDNGQVILNLATDPGDPLGIYTIIVTRGDEVVSSDVEIIAEIADGEDDTDTPSDETDEDAIQPDNRDVVVTVEPSEAEIGASYEFNISGLDSNEAFDVVVTFDGETVFETSLTADASGFGSITLETSDSDPAGTYTFAVIRADESIASVDFEVLGTVASDDEDSDTTDDDEAISMIDDANTSSTDPELYADGTVVEFSEASTLRVVEFDGFAGDVITISVDSGGEFDTVATLIAPNSEEIASDDDGGFGVDPEIERIVLPETGTYTLEIRPFTVGDSGSAIVTISRNTVQTLNDTRLVTLDSKTTSDILTVEAEAGENLILVVGLVEGEVGQLVITAEQGDITLMNYQAFGLPETLNLGFVVPESGVVVIRIESDGSTVATLNAQIER